MSIKKFNIWVIMTLLFSLIVLPTLTRAAESEASIIFKSGTNIDTIIKHAGKDKSVKDQIFAMKTYTDPLTKSYKNLKINVKYAINNFIVYGTQSTKYLNAKERYDMIKAYITKNKKLPITTANWDQLLQQPQPLTKCSSLNCLTKLAQSCKRGDYTYAYYNKQIPIAGEGWIATGKTYYRINGINSDGLCSFTQQPKNAVYKITQKGRQTAIKNGMTNEQINTVLKSMNDAMKGDAIKNAAAECTGKNKDVELNISNTLKNTFNGSFSFGCSGSTCHSESYGVTCVTPYALKQENAE